jgi:ATP-dependent RNA helicase MSS116
MTVVQLNTIDSVLQGQDHVVKAKTGTGKTIAFLAPAIDRLTSHHNLVPLLAIHSCYSSLIV